VTAGMTAAATSWAEIERKASRSGTCARDAIADIFLRRFEFRLYDLYKWGFREWDNDRRQDAGIGVTPVG
jgi:hypothetical protein